MAIPKTSCPACGRPTDEGHDCEHCGAAGASDDWFEVGQTYTTAISPAAIGPEGGGDPLEVTVEFVELWESYDTRRVLLGAVRSVIDGDGGPVEASVDVDTLIVEQEIDMSISCPQIRPDKFDERVRQPAARDQSDDKVVSVFPNDGGLTVDEVVEVATGQLNLAQIRGIFVPVMDAVEQVHDEGLVHLRLAPWTVRVYDAAEPNRLPLTFLHDTVDGGPTVDGHAGLGDEDTVSEGVGSADSTRAVDGAKDAGVFASADPSSKTRDDLNPLSMREFVGDEGTAPGAGNAGLEDAFEVASDAVFDRGSSPTLDILFDSIDGFFELSDEFDEVPIIRGFSPPEMLGRGRAAVDTSCDVFSLGMILYLLVAGELPPVSVYTRHVPALPARNLRPEFPPGLQAVIDRATRPEPDERYQDVAALRRAFDRACRVMETRRADSADSDAPRIDAAVDTHIGIVKRERNPINQDAVFNAAAEDGKFSLIVVADGVSTASYGAGDLASGILVGEAAAVWDELLPAYLADESIDPTAAIQQLLGQANDRIVAYVNDHFQPFHGSPHEVMGTTALVALYHDGQVTLASLGDSRVYLHRGEAFEQLTIDHNLWTLSILEGVPADRALAMAHGDALARCLGTFVVEQDHLVAVDPEPDICEFPVTHGDTLLMTTDGLVDFAAANMLAAEDRIHQRLLSEPNPALACLELILVANRGGGGDNIGVGIANFE